MRSRFRFAIELWREDGSALGRMGVDPDFEPAEEWSLFDCLRELGPEEPGERQATFEPRWHPTRGQPYLDGFAVILTGPDRTPLVYEFPREYFRKAAAEAAQEAVRRGRLAEGDRYRFVPLALDGEEVHVGSSRVTPIRVTSIRVTSRRQPLPVKADPDPDAFAGAIGIGIRDPEDMPVVVDASVLDEIRMESLDAGTLETGGFLVGHVCRRTRDGETYARVNAQLSARHTVAEATSLTFTPETWTEARASLTLRHRDEIFLGWWHAHQAWHVCRNCSPESRRRCPMVGDFFSQHDHVLHRVAFAPAHNVALVANVVQGDSQREVTFSTFGWRRGAIALRGMDVIGAIPPTPTDRTNMEGELPCPAK